MSGGIGTYIAGILRATTTAPSPKGFAITARPDATNYIGQEVNSRYLRKTHVKIVLNRSLPDATDSDIRITDRIFLYCETISINGSVR